MCVTDRAGIRDRTRVAPSGVQRLNHWAIKIPERPSRLRLAGPLHYSPHFEIQAPWQSSRNHVCHVRHKIQMSDLGFVKIIII